MTVREPYHNPYSERSKFVSPVSVLFLKNLNPNLACITDKGSPYSALLRSFICLLAPHCLSICS